MARCQVACPEAPQELGAGRKYSSPEQSGRLPGREGLRCSAKGLSGWELTGRQASGLGMRCGGQGGGAPLCVCEKGAETAGPEATPRM